MEQELSDESELRRKAQTLGPSRENQIPSVWIRFYVFFDFQPSDKVMKRPPLDSDMRQRWRFWHTPLGLNALKMIEDDLFWHVFWGKTDISIFDHLLCPRKSVCFLDTVHMPFLHIWVKIIGQNYRQNHQDLLRGWIFAGTRRPQNSYRSAWELLLRPPDLQLASWVNASSKWDKSLPVSLRFQNRTWTEHEQNMNIHEHTNTDYDIL